MSLTIDADKVAGVLLADDWHEVTAGSFRLLGTGETAGLPGPYAGWMELGGVIVACPLTAILAVRTRTTAERAPQAPYKTRTR